MTWKPRNEDVTVREDRHMFMSPLSNFCSQQCWPQWVSGVAHVEVPLNWWSPYQPVTQIQGNRDIKSLSQRHEVKILFGLYLLKNQQESGESESLWTQLPVIGEVCLNRDPCDSTAAADKVLPGWYTGNEWERTETGPQTSEEWHSSFLRNYWMRSPEKLSLEMMEQSKAGSSISSFW